MTGTSPFYDETTAVIVVDVQNDFADPSGSLAVAGGADTIPFINEQLAAATAAGATVVYTQDWHPESTPHFAKDGGIWPVHCVGDTWGAELHPALDVVSAAIRIKKGVAGEDGYSAFTVLDPVSGAASPTGLADQLAERGINAAIVVGLATDYCVKATALDATRYGLSTLIMADGIRAVNLQPGDGARAVAEMVVAGVAFS